MLAEHNRAQPDLFARMGAEPDDIELAEKVQTAFYRWLTKTQNGQRSTKANQADRIGTLACHQGFGLMTPTKNPKVPLLTAVVSQWLRQKGIYEVNHLYWQPVREQMLVVAHGRSFTSAKLNHRPRLEVFVVPRCVWQPVRQE